MEPPKSSIVLPPVTRTPTVINSQTVITSLISVVETNAPTQLVSVIFTNAAAVPTSLVFVTNISTPVLPSLVSVTFTNTPLPTSSQQSTPSSQAQSASSQSPEVNQASAAGAVPAKSGARKFDIDLLMPFVALVIDALVLLVLRH